MSKRSRRCFGAKVRWDRALTTVSRSVVVEAVLATGISETRRSGVKSTGEVSSNDAGAL